MRYWSNLVNIRRNSLGTFNYNKLYSGKVFFTYFEKTPVE